MATSFLKVNLPWGTHVGNKDSVAFLLWQISGDTFGGVLCSNNNFFKKKSPQVIQSLKSICRFQSFITGIFRSWGKPCIVPPQSLLMPFCVEVKLQSHVECSQHAQASSRSQSNSRFPERTQKGLPSCREAAAKGSPHPLQCPSFPLWFMRHRRASLDRKWHV